jgi:hypothetical protein
MSSSGATNDRSSRARTTVMTASTLGTITRRSRAAVSRASRLAAVSPPTSAAGSASSSAVRRPCTTSTASMLSAGDVEDDVEPDQPVDRERRRPRAAAGRR